VNERKLSSFSHISDHMLKSLHMYVRTHTHAFGWPNAQLISCTSNPQLIHIQCKRCSGISECE